MTDEELANMAICLCHQVDKAMAKYIERKDREFTTEGGIRERMTAARLGQRETIARQAAEIAALRQENERLKQMLARAVEAGWLDEHWQPMVSSTEAALLAMRMAESLGIKTVWKVFGALWHRNSESLRAKYNVAMEQEKSRAFLGELRKRLR